jgi:hypothetical protein
MKTDVRKIYYGAGGVWKWPCHTQYRALIFAVLNPLVPLSDC